MNLAAGKVLMRYGNRSIIHIPEREKCRQLVCGPINAQIRWRTKLARPNLFEPDNYNYNYKEKNKTDAYGYLLLGIPIATFILGTWQVQRRKWKLNLIHDLKTRTSNEPIELPKNLEELETKEYCPIIVRGTFIHEKEFTIGPRSLIINGAPANDLNHGIIGFNNTHRGFYVITPFKLADRDLTILVNRGWVPKNLKNPAERSEEQVQGVTEVTGVVRLNETRPPFIPQNSPKDGIWYYRDLNTMAEKFGTAPVYLDMIYKEGSSNVPLGGQTRISLRNEHLSYIITWYSLSIATAFLWYRRFIKKLPLM